MNSNSGWPEAPPQTADLAATEQAPVAKQPAENPPWNGWDVTRIGVLMFVVPYLIIPITALIAQQVFYRGLPWLTVAQKPWIALSTQFGWYAVIAVYMIMFVEGKFHRSFWELKRKQNRRPLCASDKAYERFPGCDLHSLRVAPVSHGSAAKRA